MNKNNAFSIVSLVCGIAGLAVGWIPYLDYISFLFPIAAIVFGAIAMAGLKRENMPKGMAVAGFVLGIIGVALWVLMFLIALCAMGFAGALVASLV